MKVLFDHQLFSYQRIGGASKYFCELLANIPRENWETTTVYSNNCYVDALNLFEHKSFLPNHYFGGQGRIMNYMNRPTSRKVISKGKFDVLHQTHFETYFFDVLGNKPMVTTFHDTNFSNICKNEKIVKLQKLSLERADKIISVSENTKKDLLSLFDIKPEKVITIHHGVEHPDIAVVSQMPRLFDFPYILYVGTRAPNKNWHLYLKSFAVVQKKNPEIKLVCTGRVFSSEENEYISSLGLSDSVIQFRASEIQMQSLYYHCELFVFPSTYEGFGMPLLEAMVCNAPVVCSDASCFPEIAGNGACYFDPTSIDDMVLKTNQVLCDSSYREDLRKKGFKRAEEFTWKKCADEHLKVYQSLI